MSINPCDVGDLNNNSSSNIKRKDEFKTCCIPNCKSFEDKKLAFFPFPDKCNDLLAHRCWVHEVRKQASLSGEGFQVQQNLFVCEHHFRDEDIINTGDIKCLREGSIPVLNTSDDIMEVTQDDHGSSSEGGREIQFLKEIKPTTTNNLKIRNEKSLEELEIELKEKEKQLKQRQIKEKKQQEDLTYKQRLQLEKQHQEQKLKDLLEQQSNYKRKSQQDMEGSDKFKDNLRNENDAEKRKKAQIQKYHKDQKSKWQLQKESLQEKFRQEQERLKEIHHQETITKPYLHKPKNGKDNFRNSPGRDEFFMQEPPCKKCQKLEYELLVVKEKLKTIESQNKILQLKLKNQME